MHDYSDQFANAVQKFWDVRKGQQQKQRQRGRVDAGSRGAVTGGQHLNDVQQVLQNIFFDAGLKDCSKGELPGFFRSTKNWDFIANRKGYPVAVVELKSQVGSFGNNLNNRVEEMLGQARDLRLASKHGLLGASSAPIWFGYIMILEESPKSTRKVKGRRTPEHLPVRKEFSDSPSYVDRYATALAEMVKQGDLDAACLAVSNESSGKVWHPLPQLSINSFATSARTLEP